MKHVYLNNRRNSHNGFNRKRGFSQDAYEEEKEEPTIRQFQVNNLRDSYVSYKTSYEKRYSDRTIEFPKYIDLIEINFFPIFNKDLKNKFFQKYGLLPVCYKDFNRTVVFEVVDEQQFNDFKLDIEFIISSDEDVPYAGKEYNIIATIFKFRFIDRRVNTEDNENLILSIIQSASIDIASLQKQRLQQFLEESNLSFSSNDNQDIFFIEQISESKKTTIEQNFDIVQSITTSRAINVRPGGFGTLRMGYGFEVELNENLPTIGIIDTGINNIEPFKNLIEAGGINITNEADDDHSGHGTLVAGLAIFGSELPYSVKDSYRAKCKVFPIKVLHHNNGGINFPKLLEAIKSANQEKGIRIFNMSLVFYPKSYNETFSDFAYELDKLSHELDILILISVGNFDITSLEELLTVDYHVDHSYPNFFYKLESTSPVHKCENTNISIPSESLNNLSIGALAGNIEDDDNSDVSPSNIHPAYYTRKFHFDYEQKVNTINFSRNQKNKHINKPDLVFDGGDVLNEESGIEVIASEADGYYKRTSGTSLSTPLVTSMAAEIAGTYPDLHTQSIKALLINSAHYYKPNELTYFKNKNDLLKKLIGFGVPDISKALLSSDKSITMIIEDQIKPKEIISIPIFLPEYLKKAGNKLIFDISLSYSSYPDKGNHLGYLPLHMSFNLMKNLPIQEIATKKGNETVAKNGFSWSEDHYGKENILFSNAQCKQYKLQPKDLIALNGQIAIAVRCLTKDNINENLITHLENTQHKFSLIIRITEELKNNTENSLYNEMVAINNLTVISELKTDANLDLQLDN